MDPITLAPKKKYLPFYSPLFDQGSADSVIAVDASHVRITPEIHWTDGKWKWWAVRWDRLAGKQPTFLIAKAGSFSPEANSILAVWAQSLDTDVWTPFTTVTIGVSDIEFQHGSAFPPGMIYIAAAPAYPFSRTQRKVSEWLAHPLVSDTPSSAGGVLGYATGRDAGDGSGRVAPALPFYAFKISSGPGAKNRLVLTSGNHPDEAIGRFALEGALDWILAGSAWAEALLAYNDIYVYPCLNPQGVWSGYYRSCPEDPTQDMNRQWVAGGLENVDAFLAAFAADLGGAVEAALDFHAWFDDTDSLGSVADNSLPLYQVYQDQLDDLEAGFNLINGDEAGMLHKMLADSYGARIAMCAEHGFLKTKTIADWKASGAHHMEALARLNARGYLTLGPDVGCRSFNGTTNRIDFPSLGNLSGSPVTFAAWIRSDGFATPANQYVLNLQTSTEGYGIVFNVLSGGCINIVRRGATDLSRWSANGSLQTLKWTHILATHDGTFTDQTTIHTYAGGVETGYGGGSNGVTENASITGTVCIGGRTADDLRNFKGSLAQVAGWNRVLTPAEIEALANGCSPLLIPDGRIFYFAGNTASLLATPGGQGVADGTTQLTGAGTGPAIIYP